jgi:hypothetical protein
MCLEKGLPLQREEGFVFLRRRHICFTVIIQGLRLLNIATFIMAVMLAVATSVLKC